MLIEGPRWYRSRLRSFGPFLALVIPAIVGAGAYVALKGSDAPWSGVIGLLGAVAAAPLLLVVGAPLGDSDLYLPAIVLSIPFWMLVGYVAARRATRFALATWSDWWRHYLPMMFGVWIGAGVALLIATLAIGESLI